MLHMRRFVWAISALFLLGTPASAQVLDGVSVEPTNGDVDIIVPPSGSVTIPYTVTIGCGEFLAQADNSIAVTLSTTLPAEYNAASETVNAAPGAACATGNEVSVEVDLTLTPQSGAMGRAPVTHTITANVGDASATFAHQATTQIDYDPGHAMSMSVAFPYNFTNEDAGVLQFNVTVDITANAQTMVMFERLSAGGGTIAGLQHFVFDVEGGVRQKVFNVTWTPPPGKWDNATISFYTYSHCLNGSPCDAWQPENVTWTIFNQASPPKVDGDKGAPALPLVGLIAALGAVAVLRRRA